MKHIYQEKSPVSFYAHTHTYTYTHTHTHKYIYIFKHTHTHTHIYICREREVAKERKWGSIRERIIQNEI